MNQAQIHLALNHFPIAGAFFALLFVIWGLVRNKDDIKFAAVSLAIVAGLAALPVYFTGEGAEKIVEHKPLVTEEVIHPHEEAAEAALIVFEISVLLAIAWIVSKKKNTGHDKIIYFALLGFLTVTSLLMAKTAHLGGQIRHDEIRKDAK
jgi:uncharacterized membrane protein